MSRINSLLPIARIFDWLRSPYGLVMMSAVAWSTIGVLCKVIHYEAFAMTSIRGFAYASILTLVIWRKLHRQHGALGHRTEPSWHRTTLLVAKRIFACRDRDHWRAAIFLATNVVVITMSFRAGTAATATFLNSGALLIIAALSGLLLDEPTGKRQWVAIAIGLGGLTVLALDGLLSTGADADGTTYGLLGALSLAFGLIFLKRRENKDRGETAGLESFALAGSIVGAQYSVRPSFGQDCRP